MFAYGFAPPPDPGSLTSAQQIAMRWNVCDRVEKTLKGYSTQPDYDAFWKERDYLRLADRVKVPVLISHGLLDFNVKTWEGTSWFQALDTEKALVLGQWPHASPRGLYPDWDAFLTRWFERWLYGIHNGVENEPAVRVQTNDKKWHLQNDWGKNDAVGIDLLEGPNSFTYFDDGLLTESEMLRGIGEGRRFVRREVPHSSGIRIEGRPVLHLTAESDATSTHFVAVLCDVGPAGNLSVISRAFLNARYTNSLEHGRDLVPGKKQTFDLEFIDKDYIVAKHHHLALLIGSSSDTWVAPNEQRATNTLYLNASSLDLPLH
jgi:X-Pro dipeptidyl-peptidase